MVLTVKLSKIITIMKEPKYAIVVEFKKVFKSEKLRIKYSRTSTKESNLEGLSWKFKSRMLSISSK